MEKPVIGIVAHKGMVGSTTFNYFKKQGYPVMGWSRSNRTHEWEEIIKADYIFVCVPTPYDWRKSIIDLSGLKDTLKKLDGTKAKIIIKSTIPPKTTADLQKKFPSLPLLFNPEFLSEATCETDFMNPDRQIVGYTDVSFSYATEVLHLLPNSPYDVIMTSTEAEIVKYVNNFHGSLMVIFANFIFDICQKAKADYELVKKASTASKWVGSPMGRMYWDVYHGGFRGYGGKCFPKDMHNLSGWCFEHNISDKLLDAVIEENERLLRIQGLTEEQVEKHSSRIS